jgi:hypothetical protein
MTFIEWERFHDKRTNITFYERLCSILFAQSHDAFIEWELFHDERRNLTV